MGWIDALLGRIRSNGADVNLGNGLNFGGGLSAAHNTITGYIDVTASSAPTTSDADTVPYARVTGGQTVFDYLKNDDIKFGDRGVPIGRYMSAAGNVFATALAAARKANPGKIKFLIPPGEWAISQITDAQIPDATPGLGAIGSNIILDGEDRDRCILYRTTAGGMMLWNTPPTNVVVQNVTFDFREVSARFSSSLNAIGATRFLAQDCAFLCSIPNSVTDDGIRHQLNFSGSHLYFRRNRFKASQLRLCNLGESTEHADAFDNVFEDCNDLGISCVAGDGDGATDFIRNVRIGRNKFHGILKGSGYIYVGSDAATTNLAALSDIDVFDNLCTGSIGQLGTDDSRPASRYGIYVVVGKVNKRIRLRGNTVATDNPTYSTPIVTALAMFHRDIGTSTSTEDALIEGNSTDFRSDDSRAAIFVDAPGVTGLKVKRNTVAAGSRGMVIGACSHSDIEENVVHTTTSTGLLLDSTRNAMADVRVRRNDLDAAGSFSSTIQFSGNHNMTRIAADHNRLVTATGSSAVNALTGGATLDLAYNYNSHSAGLSGTITPSQNVGNRTE